MPTSVIPRPARRRRGAGPTGWDVVGLDGRLSRLIPDITIFRADEAVATLLGGRRTRWTSERQPRLGRLESGHDGVWFVMVHHHPDVEISWFADTT